MNMEGEEVEANFVTKTKENKPFHDIIFGVKFPWDYKNVRPEQNMNY